MKKIGIFMIAMTLVLVSSVGAMAASPEDSPATIIEEVTGLNWDEIRTERKVNGKTAGEIAEEKESLENISLLY